MADKTGISWTDATWNPIVGCSVVSPGCTNCYAMRDAARIVRCSEGAGRASHYEGTIEPSKAGPVWTSKVALAPDHIVAKPLSWRRPRRIFVNSMGDLFHESVPDEWIDRVFAVMALAPQHTFQVLTKRSARMREYLSGEALRRVAAAANRIRAVAGMIAWPLPNVWLGVTAEDQTRANDRVPDLLATPAAVRFVSCEPMLGPVDFSRTSIPLTGPSIISRRPSVVNALTGGLAECGVGEFRGQPIIRTENYPRLDWVICGGESGPNARPMHPDWARGLRDQCSAAGVPFHFKQWGEWSDRVKVLNISRVHAVFDGNNYRVLRNWGDAYQGFRAGDVTVARVGTRRTGWLLDGVEHKGFPGGEHADVARHLRGAGG